MEADQALGLPGDAAKAPDLPATSGRPFRAAAAAKLGHFSSASLGLSSSSEGSETATDGDDESSEDYEVRRVDRSGSCNRAELPKLALFRPAQDSGSDIDDRSGQTMTSGRYASAGRGTGRRGGRGRGRGAGRASRANAVGEAASDGGDTDYASGYTTGTSWALHNA
jgi:hypothetical protein